MAKQTPKQPSSTRARASRPWRLWVGWVVVTTASGAVAALLRGMASGVFGEDGKTSETWLALLAMSALMAIVQWLIVRQRLRGDEGLHMSDEALRWRVATLAGCIPALSVALHGIGASSILADVLSWYAPVALFSGFLSASVQTEVVAKAFGWVAGRCYVPLTTVGWAIAWPLWVAGVAGGTMPRLAALAWDCMPGAVIGTLSGIALLTAAHPPRSSVRHIAMIGPFPRGGTDVAQPQESAPEHEREREVVMPAR